MHIWLGQDVFSMLFELFSFYAGTFL